MLFVARSFKQNVLVCFSLKTNNTRSILQTMTSVSYSTLHSAMTRLLVHFLILFPVLIGIIQSNSDLSLTSASFDIGNESADLLAVTSPCPVRCRCAPVTKSPPCDWCSSATRSAADSDADASSDLSPTSSSHRSLAAAADDVSCEGCGSSLHEGRHRSVTSQQPRPSIDRPEVTVSCTDAGLSAVPFELPLLTSTLDLAGNLLRRLDPGFLEFAPPSDQISLAAVVNASTGVDLLERFDGPRLINLRLRNNRIDRISSGSFRGPSAASVRVLDLADNRLTSIEHGMFSGPIAESLQQLDLSGNVISELGNGPFSALKHLIKLDLRDNFIGELEPSTFRGLSELRQLVLTGNSIRTIDRRTFKPLEKLVYIVLKGNPIGNQPIRFQV